MTPSHRTQSRCRVCGFSEIRTDEVVDRDLLLLAECPRCDHRWTDRREGRGFASGAVPFPAAAVPRSPLSPREVSSAA